MYKIKDLNGGKTIESFYKKEELLLRNLEMTYYPEPNKHIGYKVKVVLELNYEYLILVLELNHSTKKEVKDATSVDKVDKLNIVQTGFNKLKTKIDDLNADKIKAVSVDSKNVKTW